MPTPLYPTFRKRVGDAFEQLINQQVAPWSFMKAGPPFRIKRFDGKEIAYQGIGFEGSPREVFWSRYIEPFLEQLCISEIEAAVSMARDKDVDARLLLPELQGLLSSGFRTVYERMADVDRRLRGKGYPDSVSLRSVELEIQRMDKFLDERIRAEIEMWKQPSSLLVRSTNLHAMLKKAWNDPVWSKVIASAIFACVMLLITYILNLWPTIGRFAKLTEDKTMEPPASKAKQPGIAPSLPATDADAVAAAHLLETCGQSSSTKRPAEQFVPYWVSVVNSLYKARNEQYRDLENLMQVRSGMGIPRGEVGANPIQEALFTLGCLERIGYLKMEKFDPPRVYVYDGKQIDNQRIIFLKPMRAIPE